MRGLIIASLAAAGLAGVLGHSSNGQIRRRKTLGFGPVLPHAVYNTNVVPVSQIRIAEDNDPYVVAQRFAESRSSDLSSASSFQIRDDSYTDKATGVTHVYVRQYIYGIEVADGDMNINVKDGAVISYGDSFYRGSEEEDLFVSSLERGVPDAHAEYCTSLESEIDRRMTLSQSESEQVVLDAEETLGVLPQLYEWNCAHVTTPFVMASKAEFASTEDVLGDPRRALLQFMVAATPFQQLADDMLAKPSDYLEKMTATWQADFTGTNGVLKAVVENVPDAVNPAKARMAFVQVPRGDSSTALELVWKLEVEMEDNWYEAAVSAVMPHRIISVVDWASDSPLAPVPKEPSGTGATYNVFKWGVNDPSVGNRSIEKENFDALASPVGWHALPYANDPQSEDAAKKGGSGSVKWRNTTTTWGNNVFAHENWEGRNAWVNNYRPNAGEELAFDYKYDPKQQTETEDRLDESHKHINATVTQLFYTSNLVHDLYYRYGFDEVSGNFQQYNFGRGGRENDAVIANAQDGSGYNNANFMTPPDGQNGRCRMYLWNTANPYRDGDLEAGIVIHELSHGLSTRLTGGPANSGCLGWGESGGMGEGWGDFLATTIRSTRNYSDYAMGDWAANRPAGIRNYPYSLNETVNPSTYKTLDKPGYWGVHAIGEVYAQILWVVSNRLIEKHGFSDSLFPPAPLENGTVPEGDFYRPAEYTSEGVKKPLIPKHGNSLITQLVLNGMKLQPCRPSFFDARDAIIAADAVLTGGENYCDLWAGFASRGLGPNSRVDGRTPWGGGIRTDDFEVPNTCL